MKIIWANESNVQLARIRVLQIQSHILDVIRAGDGPGLTVESNGGGIDAAVVIATGHTVRDKHPFRRINMRLVRPQHNGVMVSVSDGENETVTSTDRPKRLDRVNDR